MLFHIFGAYQCPKFKIKFVVYLDDELKKIFFFNKSLKSTSSN